MIDLSNKSEEIGQKLVHLMKFYAIFWIKNSKK